MSPFKKKDKGSKPKNALEYVMLGIAHRQYLKAKYPMPEKPTYTPSKIIQKTTN